MNATAQSVIKRAREISNQRADNARLAQTKAAIDDLRQRVSALEKGAAAEPTRSKTGNEPVFTLKEAEALFVAAERGREKSGGEVSLREGLIDRARELLVAARSQPDKEAGGDT